jgi:hypothetical protein
MVLCRDGPDHVDDLPERIKEAHDPVQVQLASGELSIKKTTRAIEAILIRRALEKTKGNRTRRRGRARDQPPRAAVQDQGLRDLGSENVSPDSTSQ